LSRSVHHLSLHSFPTRRSSDLVCFVGNVVSCITVSSPVRRSTRRACHAGGTPRPRRGRPTPTAPDTARDLRRTSPDRRSPTHRRSEEHTSELQSRFDLVCRLLL